MTISKECKQYTEEAWARRRAVLGGLAQEAERVLEDLGGTEKILLKFVLSTLPLTDLGDYGPGFFLGFVRHALRAREEFPWCAALPEHLFLRDVLAVRINTEELADCRGLFYEALRDRVREKTLPEAILEVNRWCAEEATYRSTDDRTASPLAVYRCGWGRCGEESTFAVTALRSVGIAARQVYAPWWSHCDDNHAWVEAYDGSDWRFLGACEPEPALDRGWFTGAASRAMLVHTRSFVPDAPRFLFPDVNPLDLDVRQGVAAESVTARYADVGALTVTVLDEAGAPVPGARVSFSILNMAVFSEIAVQETDEAGKAALRLGRGSVWITAAQGGRLAEALVDTAKETSAVLTLETSRAGKENWQAFDFVSPVDSPKFPSALTPEQKKERRSCLDRTAALREQKMERLANQQSEEISPKQKRVLDTLTEKDRAGGVGQDVLMDAEMAFAWEGGALGDVSQEFPADVFEAALLSPRIGLEPLRPWREKLLFTVSPEERERFRRDPPKAWAWVLEAVREDTEGYAALCGTPAGALALGAANEAGRRNLFCALCRSVGVPARLSPTDGVPEYWEPGRGFQPVSGAARPCCLELRASAEKPGLSRQNFTLSRGGKTGYEVIATGDVPAGETRQVPLAAGEYRVLTVSRMPNGNQFAQRLDFSLEEGERKNILLSFREGKASDLLEHSALPPFSLRGRDGAERESTSLLGERPYSLFFWLEVSREPTEHILNELREAADAFTQAGCPLHFILENPEDEGDPTLQRTLKALPDVALLYGDFQDTPPLLARRMYVDPERLPLVLLADSRENGLYACSGYNVGTAELLLRLLAELSRQEADHKK